MNTASFADIASATRWDAALLEPLAELNEEVLAVLFAPSSPGLLPAPGSLAWQWRGLTVEARRRAAGCPFLLLDLGLARPGPWPAGGCHLGMAGPGQGAAGVADTHPAGTLPPGLVHKALLFAWHLARAHRDAAHIALGMGPQAAEALAARRFGELEQLALQRPGWARPRWHDRPGLWQAWLAAAAFERHADLERLRLWGLQMLAAEVLQGGVG
jgi:hypothetical protein